MKINTAEFIISNSDVSKCPNEPLPEYAFIGRSNVGKSSLINMLVDNHKLAKTSGTPGKTQLINHFDVNSSLGEEKRPVSWYLVDLPGYGFAKVSHTARNRWGQMIENYIRKRENLTSVFVLLDSRHEPQKIDLDFIHQLGKWQVPFSLVFTKADKETQKVVSRNVQMFLDEMRKTWQFLPRHFVTSAEKKMGREKILSFIEETL